MSVSPAQKRPVRGLEIRLLRARPIVEKLQTARTRLKTSAYWIAPYACRFRAWMTLQEIAQAQVRAPIPTPTSAPTPAPLKGGGACAQREHLGKDGAR